ncbi:MAG: hypothetical protein DRI28_01450 [Caldiserica bacterium]|nr:MAG: hypothetical protein DRI28_01450 [Caldisericota bacterium]
MKTKMVVLVDNEKGDGLIASWGLSIYIERNDFKLLFDTGDNPEVLIKNAEKLDIDLSKIDTLVFSHNHYDHTGGFPYIGNITDRIPVYIPEKGMTKAVEGYGLKPIYVKGTLKIHPNFTLYKFEGPIPEQSLIAESNGRNFLVVGCSHPKIENMLVEIIQKMGIGIFGIIGGFHLYTETLERFKRIKEIFVKMGVKEIYPIHCTGKSAREFFSKELKGIYKGGKGGTRIEF